MGSQIRVRSVSDRKIREVNPIARGKTDGSGIEKLSKTGTGYFLATRHD